MGKSYTPTFRVEYRDNASRTTSDMIWDCKTDGQPTVANLEKWRQGYNRSFNHGGTNYHVSLSIGIIVHINKAWIVRQSTDEIVAATAMPTFEVV